MDDQSAQGSLVAPGGAHVSDASPAEAGAGTPYRVLARKYRPTNFAELVGQDALVRTLSNALDTGRLAHAFILTGVRGVGKTTTARIIARALNCIGPDGKGGPTIQPCGVCDNCVAISQDRHVDVLEMDAASRTGINDVRELIDGVRYRPVSARYKVYIIDEVHMLSTQAFNGLLKTLEEPPEHVKFIFATTEIRKVPVTVLSRCQRFDLRRVSSELLMGHFDRIARAEGATLEPEALALVARAADGSVRDGLSILDQAIAHAGAAPVSAARVREMLGVADRTQIFDLAEALLRGDARAALVQFGEMHDAGADPVALIQDLLELTHWLTRLRVAPDESDDPTVAEAERVRGRDLAGKLSMPVLTRFWQLLLKGLSEAQHAPAPRLAVEMLFVRVAYAATLPTPAEVLAQLSEEGGGGGPGGGRSGEGEPVGSVTGGAPSAAGPSAAAPAPVARPLPPPAVSPGGSSAAGQSPSAVQGGYRAPQASASRASSGFAPAGPSSHSGAAAERVAPDPEPDPEPAPAAAAEVAEEETGPASFAEAVALFAQHGEMLLHSHLCQNVHLVAFRPGRIEIRPTEWAPPNLSGTMATKLSQWTGLRWVVSVASAVGEPTLAQQEEARIERLRSEAAEHPMVQAVVAAFPGAEIAAVRVAAPLDPAADAAEAAPSAAAVGAAPPASDGYESNGYDDDGPLLDEMAELDFSDGMDEEDR